VTRPFASPLGRRFLLGLLLAAVAWPGPAAGAAAARGRSRDIVVLRSERWIDTVRGAVKNAGLVPAEDVVLDVRFRNARGTVLGTASVRVGPLQPGQEREFQVPMAEPLRSAASWKITLRATFRPTKR